MKNQEPNIEPIAGEKPLSAEFKTWSENGEKMRGVLEGSHVFTEPWDKEVAWKEWEGGRRFITEAINKGGTILDYGCANGFLLRSLQEWSVHTLEPYGIDVDQNAVEKARQIFPDKTNHFLVPEEQLQRQDFPHDFDFVYWNVWDNWRFEKPEGAELLRKLQTVTKKGGRLILGLYDTKEENYKRVEQLRALGFQPTGTIENPKGEQMLLLFDNVPKEKQ